MSQTRFTPASAEDLTAALPGLSRRLQTAPVPQGSIVAERHRDRDYALRRMLLAGDLAALSGSFLLALIIASVRGHPFAEGIWFLATLPGWALILRAYGLYERSVRRIAHSALDDLPAVFHALVIGTLLLWTYYRLLPVRRLALAEVASFASLSLVGGLAMRHAIRGAFIRFKSPERVMLIGTAGPTKTLLEKIAKHPEYGLEPVGVVAARLDPDVPPGNPTDVPVLGTLDDVDIADTVERHGVDRVLISEVSSSGETQPVDLLTNLHRAGVKVGVLPHLFDALGSGLEPDEIEGVPVLGVRPPDLSRSSRTLKRAMDLAVSSIALAVCAPLLAVIALAIKLDSKGPVFFRQTRIGKDGRHFRLVKFRTMIVDAEAMTAGLMRQSNDPDWLLLDHDPRVTRVGRFLRRSSLDELPQLWNVIRGEMSLVGPRPLSEDDDQAVEGWGRTRLDLVPGITGLWQVLGRTSIPFEEMVKLDYLYVTNWSLWGDCRLLLRTLPVVLNGRGVN